MIENKFTSNVFRKTRIDDFRVNRVNGQYEIPKLFPHIRSLRRQSEGRLNKTPKESEYGLLQSFFSNADEMGLEVGTHNPAITIERISGLNTASPLETPDLIHDQTRMRINDGKGNDIRFNISYQMGYTDGEEREWNRIVIRVKDAKIDGKKIDLTPEMQREGFVFLSHDMPAILEGTNSDQSRIAFVRQETPDPVCFIDGHKSTGGNHELGCTCREERAESLKVIHKNGGVSCLMPGTGNGNGSEAQDRQEAIRAVMARRGLTTIPYHEIYPMMGKSPDNRGDALAISTYIMENLFRFNEVQSITALTDSSKKRDIWSKFNPNHSITSQPLESSKRDHTDFAHKQEAHGYIAPSSAPTEQPPMI